jgi:hypothetical protein
LLAQYAFATPGTSAEVETLFSIIKHVWGSEKGQLSMNALEAHLEIKYNDAADCREFFNRVKGNKMMLSEVFFSTSPQIPRSDRKIPPF